MAEIISGQFIAKPSIVIKIPSKPSYSMYLLHSPLSFNTTKFTISISCTATTSTASTKKPEKSVVFTKLLLDKYGFTEESLTKALTRSNGLLHSTSIKTMEEMLELLQDYGFSPTQIRRVIDYDPRLFTLSAQNNVKPKLDFLNSIMNGKDVAKLVSCNARPLHLSLNPRLKSAVSFLKTNGFEGESLARLVSYVPDMLCISEEKALRLFKEVEGFGFTKRSRMFPIALRAVSALKKDTLEQKLQHMYGLGFSEEEVAVLLKSKPKLLVMSKDKMKRNVEFLVNSAGVPLSKIVKYPDLLMYSTETRMIPRYRVVKALNSMTEIESIPNLNFPTIIRMTEECFLEKFVDAFSAEASILHDIYRGVNDGEEIGEIEKDLSQVLCL